MWRSHIATLHCKYTTSFWLAQYSKNAQINVNKWPGMGVFSFIFVHLQRTRCVLYKRTRSKAIAHSLPLESGKFKLTVDDEHVARALVYTLLYIFFGTGALHILGQGNSQSQRGVMSNSLRAFSF